METLVKIAKKVLRPIYYRYVTRPVYNYFKTNFEKKVLISYITRPFRTVSLAHTNFFEVVCIAEVFHELGYSVDVLNYDSQKDVDFDDYSVIFGFGNVFKKFFESHSSSVVTIFFGAGMHACHQNKASLGRVKDFHDKYGVWLTKSARIIENLAPHQTSLVDGIISLGNDYCARSYKKYYHGKVFSVPASFYKICDYVEVIKNRKKIANSSYLWFGSSGLLHKGLDLCVDYFSRNSELTLHICGDIGSERDFIKFYDRVLQKSKNIICHGFVSVDSELFLEILKSCSFMIFPSCSEGGSPSVLNVVGNGALIPLITKETTVTVPNSIYIENINTDGIARAISQSRLLENKELVQMQHANGLYVNKNNNQTVYKENIHNSIVGIIDPLKN